MGELATRERFRCVRDGSWATYGYVPGLNPTAAGQVSIYELIDDHDVREDLKLRGVM